MTPDVDLLRDRKEAYEAELKRLRLLAQYDADPELRRLIAHWEDKLRALAPAELYNGDGDR